MTKNSYKKHSSKRGSNAIDIYDKSVRDSVEMTTNNNNSTVRVSENEIFQQRNVEHKIEESRFEKYHQQVMVKSGDSSMEN